MVDNYIRIYDNVLPEEYCDDLVKRFNSAPEDHVIEEYDGMRSFTQINFMKNDKWTMDINGLMPVYNNVLIKYKEDCNITNKMFPKNHYYEQIRMKRYMPNDKDQFDDHVDVGDYDTARRFLAFFIYLTDNDDGETVFPHLNISIKPKKGRILVFPPLWNYVHAGRKVKTNPKYIVGSYLHYV